MQMHYLAGVTGGKSEADGVLKVWFRQLVHQHFGTTGATGTSGATGSTGASCVVFYHL